MALSIRGISCEYASGTTVASTALRDVTIELEQGALTVVLGPTGSGKTTLLRAASGLLGVSSGSVTVDDRPVTGPGSIRGSVGLVFQRPEAQFFALTVVEDCAFGPRNLGRDAAEAAGDACAALVDVGLDPDVFGEREPWSLSGGEARRAAIAGVLAMRPRYLLMDEPTAGLDAAGRRAVIRAIERARRHAGVLVVTHDPEMFLDAADQVCVLREGRAVFAGDVPGLLSALPGLADIGAVDAPEVPRALLLARDRSSRVSGGLTLDPKRAAHMLASAFRGDAS